MSGSRNLSIIVTASLAGLLFGFDTVVISGVTGSVGKVFHLEPGSFWYGFAVASALLGTLIGWDPLESTCRHASLSIL